MPDMQKKRAVGDDSSDSMWAGRQPLTRRERSRLVNAVAAIVDGQPDRETGLRVSARLVRELGLDDPSRPPPHELVTHVGYAALLALVEREGEAPPIPASFVSDGVAVGRWVARVRSSHKRGLLSSEAEAALDRLPGWSWRGHYGGESPRDGAAHELSGQEVYQVLVRLVEREGRLPWLRKSLRVEGYEIGQWVQRVRTRYRKGQLSSAAIDALQAMPGWTWEAATGRPAEVAFADRAEELLAYLMARGSPDVPATERRLSPFSAYVRTLYRQGKLAPDIAARFAAIPGWEWQPRARHSANTLRLMEYAAKGGTLENPPEPEIRRSISEMRRQRRNGVLTPETIRAVEGLPGWSWGKDPVPVTARKLRSAPIQKEEGLALLRAFVAREGHARVPKKHVEAGRSLGRWVAHRRVDYRRGFLPPSFVDALEAMPGWSWNPAGPDVSGMGVEELIEHIVHEAAVMGSAFTTSAHIELRRSLRMAINRAYKLTAGGELTRAQQMRLEAIPGWSWGHSEARFRAMIDRLVAFVKRTNRLPLTMEVDTDGSKIGRRVERMRWMYRRGLLSRDQIRQLEKIPGWIWELDPFGRPESRAAAGGGAGRISCTSPSVES